MRSRTARSLFAGSSLALLVGSSTAHAQQIDTNPPLPNVLLLVDSSGSMERMINNNLPEQDPNALTASGTNACNCVDMGVNNKPVCTWTGTPPSPNRWALLQETFTGSLQNGYNCVAMPRAAGATSTFVDEYGINGGQPYDTNYFMPNHRMVAADPTASNATTGNPAACVVAPGGLNGATPGKGVGITGAGLGGAATDFTGSCNAKTGVCTGSLVTREYGLLSNPITCSFMQNADGALTQMSSLMRFGLMTFDDDPGAGIGVTTGANPQVLSNAFAGMWSYYPGWSTGAPCPFLGNPAGCTTGSTVMAVGARNPGAPAWEGRLVPFPATADIAAQTSTNQQVGEVMLASRPYGATPTAGMFAGAQYFLLTDPTGPQKVDPYVQGGCRNEYIIHITDGAPNLDLQPSCSNPGSPPGVCPFPTPIQTAATLYNNGNSVVGQPSVQTFVIGFAVSTQQGNLNCSTFAQGGSNSGQCQCNDKNLLFDSPYGPCCELQCLAAAGGTNQAYFADTQGDLQAALGAILAQIAKNTTTRSTPAYSPVITNVLSSQTQPQTNASVFLASFNPSPGKSWSGDVQRERYQCTYSGSGYTVPAPTITNSLGDDFAANLNSNTGPARTFVALQPDLVGGTTTVDSGATIRPYVTTSVGDGLGKYSATTYAGTASTVMSSITAAALNVPAAGCAYVSNQLNGGQKYLTQAQCGTMVLDYTFAQAAFGGAPADFTFQSRYGNAFGDIFHANPYAVGPPGSLLQDPTYVGFRQLWSNTNTSAWSVSSLGRKQVVYTATNDGLLHAFWADETKLENNEMWALLLPQAAANVASTYPSSHAFLLDGSPVIQDVVWDRDATTTSPTVWHTMLVAGYGSQFGGYYAVDVTNPDPTGIASGGVPADPGQNGPVFRWQLTRQPSAVTQTNYPLFGSQSATPAIATMFFDPGDGNKRDIGVAILPGGQSGPPTSSLASGAPCARATKSTDSGPPSGFPYRGSVQCWGASNPPKASDPVVGRSVTIVRVDTGEIIRTFTRLTDVSTSYPKDTLLAAKRVIDTPLDSPMTGTPVVYPSDVGTDTTKFFIGDADGTMWKFDVSDPNPSNWTGELFLDFYNTTADPNTSTGWGDGQPFQVNPVLSLDTAGNVVVNAASGNIQQFDTTGIEFVYSISETSQGSPAKLRANVNWWLGPKTLASSHLGFDPGERVSGPMTVFNGTLYFSTYAAAAAGTQVCTGGTARIWGRDYVAPDSSGDLSQGGLRELQPPTGIPQTPPPYYIQPSDYDATVAGKVIPGVSIMGTPACASAGNSASDQYVAGAQHSSPTNFASGGYSLFTQIGAKGTNGQTTKTFEMSVPTPVSPTIIDSWAAVLE